MNDFDQRVQAMSDRLEVAILANLSKYSLDFSNQRPGADKALRLLGDSIIAYGMGRIDETQVKPNFLAWVRAIKL